MLTDSFLQNIITDRNKDPLGQAVLDFYKKSGGKSDIVVHSEMFEDDVIPVEYLFRKIDQMPNLEQKALAMSKGRILDVGAGSGCHSLELQKCGFDVTAVDISPLAVETMKQLGVKNTIHSSILDVEGEFDTIMLLMNGIGVAGTVGGLTSLLKKLDSILKYDGQIILDSSDICYLFEMEDGSYKIDISNDYYGEVDFQMSYGEVEGDTFKWLYVDPKTLEFYANKAGFKVKIVRKGDDGYSYLAQLKKA